MEEKTHFAPALRSTMEEILKEHELVASQKFFHEIFGTIPGIGAVINKNREIIYSNPDFLNFFGFSSIEPILGKRPGEVISCIHSAEEASGCGTSRSCAYCGSVNAILESQSDRIIFWVKNDQVIPKDVQMQLFTRSYSTKSQDRGIGTYSIRLLTENYLKGKVSFISNEIEGTIFSIVLNKTCKYFLPAGQLIFINHDIFPLIKL